MHPFSIIVIAYVAIATIVVWGPMLLELVDHAIDGVNDWLDSNPWIDSQDNPDDLIA